MNYSYIKAPWFHNHMPEYQKKNSLFFQTATDTTGGRAASYIAVVYDDVNNSQICAYTAYGKITASHTRKDLAPYPYSDSNSRHNAAMSMKSRVGSLIQSKLDKNYVQQDIFVDSSLSNSGSATQVRTTPKAKPLPKKMTAVPPIEARMSIRTSPYDFPDRDEVSKFKMDALIDTGDYAWERYPNRMRMTYIVLYRDVIALYNISGGLTADIKYDSHYHVLSDEMLEDIGDGLIFTGHRDPAGNLVVHQYLGKVDEPSSLTRDLTWAKQKSMTTYFFNTLYNKKEDIYDTNLPIYLSDYVTDRRGVIGLMSMVDYGYASNIAFHDPHRPVKVINVLER